MSEMSDEELDYNKIEKGLYSIKTLRELKNKYKGKSYMTKKINEVLKKSEERIEAELEIVKAENLKLKNRIRLVLKLQEQSHNFYANTGLNVWSLTTKQVLQERKILSGNEGDNQQSSK